MTKKPDLKQQIEEARQRANASLDELIAQHLYGWKWISYVGIPIKGTPDYPKQCRVRYFAPPRMLASKEWREYLSVHEVSDATGDEPLAYDYCSSAGYDLPPSFSNSESKCLRVLVKAMQAGGWKFRLESNGARSKATFFNDAESFSSTDVAVSKAICRAALAALGVEVDQ